MQNGENSASNNADHAPPVDAEVEPEAEPEPQSADAEGTTSKRRRLT